MGRLERMTWGTALLVVAALVLVAGLIGRIGSPAEGATAPKTQRPPAWMHKLGDGEQPPQFVLFSFDGAGDHEKWRRFMVAAEETGAHVTGFLSGVYLLPDNQRDRYQGPGHPKGRSSIGFGGTARETEIRVQDLNAALAAGHELGTHYNGHFCTGAEPSVGHWDTAAWNDELDQFFAFAAANNLPTAQIKGGRTPCLEGRLDQLYPALQRHEMTYDSSAVANGLAWPHQQGGIWEIPMPTVRVPKTGKRVVVMDYNLWYSFNGARNEPARAEEFAQAVLDTYRSAYRAALDGNRAPLVIGNHFNDWSGDAFNPAAEAFMREVCPRQGTECVTYSELIEWMQLQDPAVLAHLQSRPLVRP
jgi:hypothetical protein